MATPSDATSEERKDTGESPGAGVAGASAGGAGAARDQSPTLHRTLHGTQVVLKRTAVVLVYVVALLVGVVVAVLYVVVVLPPKRAKRRFWDKSKEDEVLTNDWWGLHDGDDVKAREKTRPKAVNMRKDVELRTCYITTRDGVKLATDVWIPVKALEKKGTLPVVFHQARYYRSATLRWPFNLIVNGGKPISFINDPFFKSFLSHGMVLVSVDVRGTGASFGTHPGPWSCEEQQDSLEVLDWVDRQPWSSGQVALWGVSYEGTSAFFTSLLKHPTVVCCCPMFFFWDVYDDISHPGGVPMRHFSVSWQGFNDSLDSGWVQSTGWMARVFLEGVTPVAPEDSWGYQANQAIIEHKSNWSLLEDDHIRYMDDTSRNTGRMVRSACASQALQQLLAKHGFHGASTQAASRSGPESPSFSSATAVDVEVGWTRVPPPPLRMVFLPPPPLPLFLCRMGCMCGHWSNDFKKTRNKLVPPPSLPPSGKEQENAVSGDAAAAAAGNADDGQDESVNVNGNLSVDPTGETGSLRRCKRSGDGGGGGEEARALKDTLPFYLHVSGWLDASAHAAIMAFTAVPCRGSELLIGPWSHGGHQHVRPHHITTKSKFDFTTEVSGFFVRRLLSTPTPTDDSTGSTGIATAAAVSTTTTTTTTTASVAAADVTDTEGSGGSCACTAETAAAAAAAAAATAGDVGTSAAAAAALATNATGAEVAPSSPGASPGGSSTPFLVASCDDGGDGDDGGGDGGGGGGGTRTEVAAEGASVLPESNESKALWKRARPRVRYFTHQEERWHDATEFPSTFPLKTNLNLFLGGKQQQQLQKHLQKQQEQQRQQQQQQQPLSPSATGSGLTPDLDLELTAMSTAPTRTAVSTGGGEAVGGGGGADRHDQARVTGAVGCFSDGGSGEDGEGEAGFGSEKRQLLPLAGSGDAGSAAVAAAGAGAGAGAAVVAGAVAGTPTQVDGGGRGMGVRSRVSKRLANWSSFRKSQLTLSQDPGAGEEETTHELEVDILEDHDGEGISRWAAMTQFWSLISYQMDGMRSNHLRFTSAPLARDIEVTGYPVVTLWVSVTDDLPNLDVFAYLQAVRPRTGLSIYVTEGCFRAEHRKEAERITPVDVRALPGVPIHSYLRADAQPLVAGQPVEIRFKLSPTSFKFLKGQRVRLSIGGADARHFHPITRTPSPSSTTPTPPAPPNAGGAGERGAEAGAGAPSSSAGGGAEGGTSVIEKRVLRVHTGGAFASGVSLPVPHSGNSGPGLLGAARAGAKGPGDATAPRIARLARSLWRRRTRSLSIPDRERLLSLPEGGDTTSAVRRLSEGRLQDVVDLPGIGTSTGLFEG
ncbi:unnamed protein product [Pylaiella littoralis]